MRTVLGLAAAALFALLALGLINKHVGSSVAARIETSITEIPVEEPARVAIVFGATRAGGESEETLSDRVVTAVELYRSGRVKKILISGDGAFGGNLGPQAMRAAAEKLGVPPADITIDNSGTRIRETCLRARNVFDVSKAILVDQAIFLPRSLYICEASGLDSIGITADRRRPSGNRWLKIREFFAVAAAWFEMNVGPAKTVGRNEPV